LKIPSLSHEFRDDKESFQKDKSVRKGPSKQKIRTDIVKILDEIVSLKVTVKKTIRLIKVVFGNSLMQGIDITPQYWFDASGAS
jgi:hypothetical protein